jgi:GTPase SAR1 family protein
MATSTKQIRILLLGDSATGKHCYVKRLTHNIFAEDVRVNVRISFFLYLLSR